MAATSGEFRLEVALSDGPRGPCPLRLDPRRPATATDRARVLAETALARGHELRRTRKEARCRAGIAPYREAERGFRALGLAPRRAEALLGLGLLDKDCLRDPGAALPVLAAALPLFAGEDEAEAKVRQHLGEVRAALGDLGGAIVDYRRALALRRKIGRRADEALTAESLGLALSLEGRYDEAATAFDRALALWQEGDPPIFRAETLLNRGRLHLDLGETERARQRFRTALALYRQARNAVGEAVTLNALGIAALVEGKPDEALAPLTASLALREPGSRGQAVTLNTLGGAYRRLGRQEDARRAYAAALPIFVRLGDRQEQARNLANLGWLEATAAHDEPALADFDQARSLFSTLGDLPDLAGAWRGRAEALCRRGRLEEARRAMEEALAAIEDHRFRQASYATRAAFFGTQQGSYDFFIDLLMEMHRQKPTAGYDARALEVSERALARSLLDVLAATDTDLLAGSERRDAADRRLAARARGLEAEVDALAHRQTQLARNESDAALGQLRAVDEELARRWEELDRVRAELRAKSPRYAALTAPRTASAEEIRRLLDRDTLLLEYHLGAARSFLWAWTPETSASFELPGRAELVERASRAGQLLARSRARKAEIAADQQLAKLSSVLLGPVAGLLGTKRLLIVGDGMIQTLPFAALPDPRGGAPLVAHHEVVSLPSVSVLAELRREVGGRPAAPRSLWVLADPDFGGAFPPLPYSRQEAEAVLTLAPAGERTALLGRQASREAVLNGPLSDYRFLHFATHNSFGADPGTDSHPDQLVLAQVDAGGRKVANGFLHLADIYGLDLRADLVVLSACQSALGREVQGEGLVGMTRGFFYAGAERVLVSLWNVNDRVTVELMRIFYQGVFQQGLSPAAALRAAQDAIRRQERWRSPYYWAGFVLEGEWRGLAAHRPFARPPIP